jgi:uncharacterized integral membrane protein
MQKIRWTILLIGVVILLTAMIQNSATTTLKFFTYQTQLPVSVLLLTTSATSFLLGAITAGRMLKRSTRAKLVPAKPLEKTMPEAPKTTPTA